MKIRLAVKLPTVLLVSMTVNPMAVLLVLTELLGKKVTPGCEKTSDRLVCIFRAASEEPADVITHVHTLYSLSPGHRS